MKKTFYIISILLLIFVLGSCGKNEDNTQNLDNVEDLSKETSTLEQKNVTDKEFFIETKSGGGDGVPKQQVNIRK